MMKSALLFMLYCCIPAHGAAQCIEPDIVAPVATLDLKLAFLDRHGEFVGVFELVNFDHALGLAVALGQEAGQAFVRDPTAQVEFRDLNENWVALDNQRPVGDFIRDPEGVRTIGPGERLQFRYRMFSRHLLRHGGTAFRLRLFTEPPTRCLLSFPFAAVPRGRPPQGLRPVPHPRPIATTKPR